MTGTARSLIVSNSHKKEMALDILEHVIEETNGPTEFLEVLANIVIMYCETGKTDANRIWAIEIIIDILISYMEKKNLKFKNFELVFKNVTHKEEIWH